MLEAIGFTVTAFAARVVWTAAPGGPPNPRTHMVLKVEGDGVAHIADVGFGGFLSAAPVPLPAPASGKIADEAIGPEQPVPGGALRLRRSGMFYFLQARSGAGWRDVYHFTAEPQLPIDIEVANWFTSTHPGSRFRNHLMLQRLLPDGRISLLNRSFTRRPTEGSPEDRTIASADDLEQVLRAAFGIEPPPGLAQAFARLPHP